MSRMMIGIGQEGEVIMRVEGKWHFRGARAMRECVGCLNEVLDLLEEARGLLERIEDPHPRRAEVALFLEKTGAACVEVVKGGGLPMAAGSKGLLGLEEVVQQHADVINALREQFLRFGEAREMKLG